MSLFMFLVHHQWMEALRRMQGPTLPLPAFQPN